MTTPAAAEPRGEHAPAAASANTAAHADAAQRVFGLDALRAFAVSCVVLAHCGVFKPPEVLNTLLFLCGNLGVEVFFVLSGFLIGRILLRHPPRDAAELFTFWGRRWLRTLPPYFLVLGVLAAVFTPANDVLLRYAVFLQCVLPEHLPPRFFPVSWSLAVEEWFYLWLPFLLLGGRLLLGTRIRAVHLLALLLVLTAARWCVLWEMTFNDAKYLAWLRFDALLWGVLAAAISLEAPDVWRRVRVHAAALALPAAVGAVAMFWMVSPKSFAMRGPMFTLVSMAVALLLPAAAQWRVHLTAPTRLVMWLAAISYPLYLVHLEIMQAASAQLREYGLFAALPAGVGAALLAAHLMHIGMERPLLAWRDRVLRAA